MTNEAPILATIKSKFDLGYLVELENGKAAQLRVTEQKGRELARHIAGQENTLLGETIPVYIIYQDQTNCLVSQFSPKERISREKATRQKNAAIKNCRIGDTHTMVVIKDYEWGYLCEQINGYLVGAIKKPTQELTIGQRLTTKIVAKNKHGSPYLISLD